MLILLCYTSAFSEVIYADFYAKILDWNFRLLDDNSQILVIVFISKLNFSFSFPFVDENCRIFVIVVVFVTKINLFSSTKIFVFVVVDEKNCCEHHFYPSLWTENNIYEKLELRCRHRGIGLRLSFHYVYVLFSRTYVVVAGLPTFHFSTGCPAWVCRNIASD